MRFTILQDLKKMKQWWKDLLIMLRRDEDGEIGAYSRVVSMEKNQ